MTKGQYGYARVGEGSSARVCGEYVTGAGRFEIGRIIPNLYYYLIGDRHFHDRLINYLGLGHVRKEYDNVQVVWLWSSSFIAFLIVTWKLNRD